MGNDLKQHQLMEVAMSDVIDEILSHHGVKGMKWGQRKAQRQANRAAKATVKADKKFEKDAGSINTWIAVHNRAAELTNAHDIDRINNKPGYKAASERGDLLHDDLPISQKYLKEHQDAFVQNLHKAAAEQGTNKSGTKKYGVQVSEDGYTWGVTVHDVKHADNPTLTIKVTKDLKGQITKLEVTDDTLAQGSMATQHILSHHGVKGMRWGRRKDRTPTAVTVTTKKGKVKLEGGHHLPAHPDAIKSKVATQKLRKSGADALSNKDLQVLQTRLNLEQNVARLDVQQRQAGQHFVVKFLKDPTGRKKIKDVATSPAGKAVGKSIKKKAATVAVTAALA